MKAEQRPRRVYVVNKGSHDYSQAGEFGELHYLSVGAINPLAIGTMFRNFCEKLKDSDPNDIILLTGLTQMSVVATTIFTYMHGRLNVLVWHNGHYTLRDVVYDNLLEKAS